MKQLLQKTFALKALLLMSLLVGAVSGAWAETFVRVNSTDALEHNAKYILVNEAKGKAMGAISTSSTTYGTAVDVIINDGVIEANDNLNVLTLSGGNTTGWSFKTSKEEKYLSWSSGNSLAATNTAEKWIISFNNDNVIIKYENTQSRQLQYNSGSPRFACYTTSQSPIQLYKQTTSKSDPNFSFSVPTATANLGETFGEPTLTYAEGFDQTITWSSTDVDVATVDGSGSVTLVGVGTTTITASYAGNEDWTESEASYELTVENPNDTRAEVNMTSFTAAKTTLVKGETIATTVGNDQDGWTAAYTYTSNNEEVATADEYGVVTAVGKGTAIITATLNVANDDADYKVGTTTSKSLEFTVVNPSHTVTFFINGNTSNTAEIAEGESITFPTGLDDISGKKFMGWATSAIDGTTNDAPEYVTSATMGQSDVTFYAVFAYATGSGSAEVTKSYGFETESDEDWTISDAIVRTEGEGNTGSYAGKISTNDTYVTFNSKVRVKEFSFAFKRTSNNNNYNVYIETSEDNSNWTAAETYAMSSFNNGSYLTKTKVFEGSPELYVRFHCNNTTAVRYVDDVTIKYSSGGGVSYSDYCTTVVAATVARPEITVAENPFIFSTTATISCTTDGATIKYSFDGETWNDYTEPLTIISTTTIYAKAVKGNDESSVANVPATKNLAVPTVTIDFAGITNTNVYEGTEAGSLAASVTYNDVAIEGAVVTWRGDNDKVATIDATGAVTLVGAGSVTFTAAYAGNEDYSEASSTPYTLTVTNSDPNVPGTENNPYTVAQAIAATPASGTSDNVYITGIVSDFYNTSIVGDGTNYRYYISDYGGTDNQLLVYKGKGLGNVAFSDADDLQLGDVVTILGGLTIYKGDAEIAANNYIVSLVRKPAAPMFSPVAGAVESGTEVTLSTTTDGATIYYTTDGSEPTTSSSVYSDVITITEATTIKAIAVKGEQSSDVATAAYTIALPVATPTFTPAAGTYSSAQEVTINCETDDATIYYSYDNENWTEYTETLNINETKTVYAKAEKEGMVTSYANAAYTMQIPSITFVNDATPKNLTYEAQNYDFAFEGAYTIGSFTVVVCDYEGNATSYDWFSAELNGNAVRVTLTQNEDMENSRTAFFKVTAGNATSEVFSVVQNNYVQDYAALPFEFNGGRSAIEETCGLTQDGLGTDYANAPYLKFDNTDDYLILKINERPGTLAFEIKGYSFSGGTFTVQTSEDGVTYTDLEAYTSLGNTQNEEFTNLGENVRYIKWIYTEKVSGNVALGNIALTAYTEPVIEPSIAIGSDLIEAPAEETDGSLTLTYANLEISDATDFGVQYYNVEGEELQKTPNWIDVEVADADENSSYVVSYVIEANEGEARTAYFKVFAMNDEEFVYSDLVTITQEAYVAPVPTIEREWAKTNLENLTEADIFVIVDNNGSTYALSSSNGTSKAPDAKEVTIEDDMITSDVTDDIQWNLGTNSEGGYTFYPNGETDKWLYCTNTNNGVRVGDNDNNVFELDGDYLYNNVTGRYVGIYNSQDWRCYTTYGGNIADQTVSFYRLVPNYERSVVVDNWGTICLPYDADVRGAQLYSIAGWRENEKNVTSIVLKEEDTMEAGKPYFFQATASSINCYQTSVEETTLAETINGLVGSFERMGVAEGMYLLSKGEIVRCGTGCSIAANRAYIDMSQVPEYVETGEAGVKMLYLYNPTTGINGIDANGEGAVIYDLSGRRLSKTQKGLYIVNGKKVAVK